MLNITISSRNLAAFASCIFYKIFKSYSFLFFLIFIGINSSFGQGQFGGKVAILDGAGNTTWYNMTSQTCDGAGTGNLTNGNINATTTYLGDRMFIGGNVLTFGYGSSGDRGELRWSYYVVGGTQSYNSYFQLPYANNTVCGGGSNKKYEYVPNINNNLVQATATGSYRLDVDLRGNNNGVIHNVYTSGNYIAFNVLALGNPTS